MKTKIISLSAVVFLLFSFMFSHAQGLRFGVRLDPQLSWYAATGDIVSNTSNRLGLNGGLVIDNYFSDNYALATGLSLSSVKGGVSYNEYTELTLSGEERTIAPNSELFYKLQYLEVPLGLKMKTREFGYITFFAQLGFTGQINIKATVETELPDSKELDATDEINLLDLGYHFGGGIEYSLGGNTALAFGIIYKNGFTDVTKLTLDNLTLNTLSLRIGVMF